MQKILCKTWFDFFWIGKNPRGGNTLPRLYLESIRYLIPWTLGPCDYLLIAPTIQMAARCFISYTTWSSNFHFQVQLPARFGM